MFLILHPKTIFPINLIFTDFEDIAFPVQIIGIPCSLPIIVQYFAGFEVLGHN
jgi:hypothetical protein